MIWYLQRNRNWSYSNLFWLLGYKLQVLVKQQTLLVNLKHFILNDQFFVFDTCQEILHFLKSMIYYVSINCDLVDFKTCLSCKNLRHETLRHICCKKYAHIVRIPIIMYKSRRPQIINRIAKMNEYHSIHFLSLDKNTINIYI